MRSDGRRLSDDSGSVSLELVIILPALLLIVGVLIFGGRLALAHQSVEAAAAQAAREASIARTQPVAASNARAAAATALQQQGLRCATTSVVVDTAGFGSPVGTPASVTATLTCVVALGDLVVPGVPGSQTVTGTASSPLDTYRER